jgi:SagB-type dehydrogenase family enzyme
LRAPRKKRATRIAPSLISARLNPRVTLETHPDGSIAAGVGGYPVALGKFSTDTLKRAQELRTGLPLGSLAFDGRVVDTEIDLLLRRLARRGLLEYRLVRSRSGKDQVVIEPQMHDYWPRTPELGDTETVVLSRFAYLRRRAGDMVLESPRSGALFRICDPKIPATLAMLSTPQQIKELRRQDGFPGIELLALLVDCQILFRIGAAGGDGLRANEGDDNLVVWDFHDLLFHTHSTDGRQANPMGGLYPYAGVMPPPPAIRPRWPGKKIDLRKLSATPAELDSPVAKLLRKRHSTRDFDDRQPITLDELRRFLDGTARVQSRWRSRVDIGDGGPMVSYAARPYPSGGSAYELELYLAVAHCEGLARGFYHYDAGGHALMPIEVRGQEFEALLTGAAFAMDTPAPPQILITIAARFDRVSWKYSSIAYALILKDVGVLLQTFYLMATDMGLGCCAIGTNNIGLFAKMTGIEFNVEGPVGQFALGRGAKPGAPE